LGLAEFNFREMGLVLAIGFSMHNDDHQPTSSSRKLNSVNLTPFVTTQTSYRMTVHTERVVRIVALGSPHGDDQVAWVIAERLSEDPMLRPLVRTLATPWGLIEYLTPACSVIVIDACVGCAPLGAVIRIDESELRTSSLGVRSTHGGSLIESLELANKLERAPRDLVVFAVAVEACEPGAELSTSARCAVDDAVRQVNALLSEWLPMR
jgi:hydrogenase maturation protease